MEVVSSFSVIAMDFLVDSLCYNWRVFFFSGLPFHRKQDTIKVPDLCLYCRCVSVYVSSWELLELLSGTITKILFPKQLACDPLSFTFLELAFAPRELSASIYIYFFGGGSF